MGFWWQKEGISVFIFVSVGIFQGNTNSASWWWLLLNWVFFFFGFGCLFFVVVIELSLHGCIGVEKAGGPS